METQEKQSLGTYDVMIAQNILHKLGLYPTNDELIAAVKGQQKVYSPILKVPVLNTLNALILAQIESYKVFCQKRLIDYVVFTNPSDEELQAAGGEDILPESFEDIKQAYEKKHQQFSEVENRFYQQLTNTQYFINKYVKNVIVRFGEYHPQYDEDFYQQIDELISESQQVKKMLLEGKSDWKAFTLTLTQTITQLGGFFLPPEDDIEQRAELVFFENLGN